MILVIIGVWLLFDGFLSIVFDVSKKELDRPIYQILRGVRMCIGFYLMTL